MKEFEAVRDAETTCVVPWSTLIVRPDGRVNFCCDVTEPLKMQGRLASIYDDTIEEIWNTDELVTVRSAMSRGERPSACASCWQRELAGGASRRTSLNQAYATMGGHLDVGTLADEGAVTGFRLAGRPDWFLLELGNVCTLRCRTCNPTFSSRIAADPIHSAWATGEAPSEGGVRTRIRLAPRQSAPWFHDIDATADMIAGSGSDNAILSLLGGEPFLIKDTWRLLQALVDRNAASRFLVGLATNGQQRSNELIDLAPHFRGIGLSVSIDGVGALYEYLRHGARWATLVENLDWFRDVAKIHMSVVPTVQNYNVLDIVELLRFADDRRLPVAYNVVLEPAYLRPTNLPLAIRKLAIDRMQAYLAGECRAENVEVVKSYLYELGLAGDEFDRVLFEEFMTFTNDLDGDRGERIGGAAPELVALVEEAGFVWSDAPGTRGRPLRPEDGSSRPGAGGPVAVALTVGLFYGVKVGNPVRPTLSGCSRRAGRSRPSSNPDVVAIDSPTALSEDEVPKLS